MRKLNLRRTFAEHLADNKLQYTAVIAVLALGTVVGAVSAAAMNDENLKALGDYTDGFATAFSLSPIGGMNVFRASMYENIKLVLFLWLSGLWIGLIPIALLQIGIRGFKLGFTTAFMVHMYKLKGLAFAVVSVMPQLVLLIPAAAVYAVFGIKYAMALHKIGRQGSRFVMREMYIRSFLCIVGITAVAALCSLADAFVVPPVLRPVCSLLVR